jgi:hypothetical protein
MAMTKAERAEMEAMRARAALGWPQFERPQPMTKEEIEAAYETIIRRDKSAYRTDETAARGWFYNAYGQSVTRGWANGHYHNHDSEFADSPRRNDVGRPQMYRTKLEALRALRWAMSDKFSAELGKVDGWIVNEANP